LWIGLKCSLKEAGAVTVPFPSGEKNMCRAGGRMAAMAAMAAM